MLYSLIERISSVWVALFIGGFVAWGYLKIMRKRDAIASTVKDQVSVLIFVFIIFSKFISGFIYHPSFNLRNDIFSMLGGSGSDGWSVGMLATILYLLYVLRKSKALGRMGYAIVGEGVVSGSMPFFAYLSAVNLEPFRSEYILRFVGAILLMLWILTKRNHVESHPQRLWGALGTLLFVTSVFVPYTTKFFIFSPAQWFFIGIIIASVIMEGIADLRGPADSSEISPSQKSET